jgi:hypothetical protein
MTKQIMTAIMAGMLLFGATVQIQAQEDPPIGDITPGTQVHATATVVGGSIQFTLYAPPTYDNAGTKRWPLIIQMPPMGATIEGAGGAGFHQLVTCGIPQELENPSNCKYVSDRFIVVSPFLHNSNYPANYVPLHNWIKYLYKTYKIDSTCVSFYGTCWGGNTSWGYFLLHPEIPSAAYLFAINDMWSATLDLTKACLLKNVGIRIARGLSDCCTPRLNCKAAYDAVHACGGGNDSFIEIPGPHEIYNFMDTISGMYDWFLTRKTTPSTSTEVQPQAIQQNVQNAMSFETRLSRNDWMEVIDVNGKLVFKSTGSGLTVNQMIPKINRGMYLVRFQHANQTQARIFISQ